MATSPAKLYVQSFFEAEFREIEGIGLFLRGFLNLQAGHYRRTGR